MDDRGCDGDVGAQHLLDHGGDVVGDGTLLGSCSRSPLRWMRGCILGEVSADGAPIAAAFAGDVGVGRAGLVQGFETADVHPRLSIKDHDKGHPSGSSTWR